MSIVIYDNNIENLKLMETALVDKGYIVKTTSNIVDSIRYIETNGDDVDLVITKYDISMFSLSDFLSIIRKLRKGIKVIVISSSNSYEDEVKSLNLQVDQYLHRRVANVILAKSVEKVLVDKSSVESIYTLKSDGIEIDVANNIVRSRGKIVHLTFKEYQVLIYLIRRIDKVVSREEIFKMFWNEEDSKMGVRVIDTIIFNLRKKLNMKSLVTIRKLGYKIEAN